MKYVVEVDSSAVIYTPGFIKIGSDIQKLVVGFADSMEIA
jgi:hypothetical protein